MTRWYQRSQILEFYELTFEQQASALEQCEERAYEGKFVIWQAEFDQERQEVLPLEMFLRVDNSSKMLHGVYGLTAFSAYGIVINRHGDEATVIYMHW